MRLPIKDLIHPITLDRDIDVGLSVDVAEVDVLVHTCVGAATNALKTIPPPSYSDYERDQLVNVVEGLRQSHLAIRRLLGGEQGGWAVDALTVARLQLESLYNVCFLLESSEHLRLLLKNAWKKKYIRFLLEREERKSLPRYDDYYTRVGLDFIEKLRGVSFVSVAEKLTIEVQELGIGTISIPVPIGSFPTPMKVIEKIKNVQQQAMLKRLYPEYQFLCSFAHGDAEATFFRTVSNTRSVARHVMPEYEVKDFYQRQVLEPPITYSAVSVIQAATEIAALCPADMELMVKVSKAWTFLLKFDLLAVPIWEIRSKHIIPIIGAG